MVPKPGRLKLWNIILIAYNFLIDLSTYSKRQASTVRGKSILILIEFSCSSGMYSSLIF